MIRECRTHGYFRSDRCPQCREAGRFVMSDDEVEHIGRLMAGILRHFPEKFELQMDKLGWVEVIGFVDAVSRRRDDFRWLRPHHIKAVVDTDPKGRYQMDTGRVRATYGHSLDVDPDLPTDGIPPNLFYHATEEEAALLLERGIHPTDRKQVHLSRTYKDAVTAGSVRGDNQMILKINARKAIRNGVVIKWAGKTVFTCPEVPAQFIEMAQKSDEEED